SGNGGGAGDDTGGNGASGEAGEGTGGMGGEGGSGSTTPALPAFLGAVRLLVDGAPRCGGTLLTNDWLLTADQCVTRTEEGALRSIRVGFGMDSTNFQQTRGVVEVQRYPGNDGTEENRGRDLLLLGVDRPFEIDGRTRGYRRRVWPNAPRILYGTQRCVGWDLLVDPLSPTNRLHEERVGGFAIDYDTTNGSRPSGNRVWWFNASADAQKGVLP